MARHYSTKNFFRQISNSLLARYFERQNLDFPATKNTKPDKIFEDWLKLPEIQRNKMDTEFKEIFELGCEKGFRAIIDEAAWQMRESPDTLNDFVVTLSALPNHYDRALTTYLDHSEYWKGAALFYHADNLSYWRKRKHMGHQHAATDDTSIRQLEEMIRDYFHCTEGRGKNCVIEAFRRGDLDYFFAYPEDYSQESVEWVDGKFDRRPHNPAFEIVFIYSQKEGTLDLNYSGSYKSVEPLQKMFAMSILKLDKLPPNPKDERIYDLNPLMHREFDFVYDIRSGIKSVTVEKIRLSSRVIDGDRITLEANTNNKPKAIYDRLEAIGKVLPLHLQNVTQVELMASFFLDFNKPHKRVRIRITYPNSCSLKYDEIGIKLRKMLEASGIEPKESTETSCIEINEAKELVA